MRAQSETEDSLIKIKNSLQGNRSRMVGAKNQITDLEHREAKNNQSEQQEENRIQRKEESVSSLQHNFEPQGCQKEKRKRMKLEISLNKY